MYAANNTIIEKELSQTENICWCYVEMCGHSFKSRCNAFNTDKKTQKQMIQTFSWLNFYIDLELYQIQNFGTLYVHLVPA